METNSVSLSRPTAVRTFERPDRRRKYVVQWRLSDGSRPYESFMTAGPRDARAADLRRQMASEDLPEAPARQEIVEFRQFKAAIGDTPWLDVVTGWKNFLTMTGRVVSSKTVDEAADEYIAAEGVRLTQGQISAGTYSQKKCKVGAFRASFAGQLLANVTEEAIHAWMISMQFKSAVTFNDYLKHVHSFFAFFPKDVPKNPASGIPFKRITIEEVGILTVDETRALFAWVEQKCPIILGRLALEAFAGLRFSSSQRLELQDINFKDRGILLPAKKIKTRRRFYIDQLPDNLWPWLERSLQPASVAGWDLTPSQYMHHKSHAFIGANVSHPHNCLRHSFASYHVAAYKNPGLTAATLCHTNQGKLWSTYNGIATNADGLLYFSVVPQIQLSAAAQRSVALLQ